MSTRAEDHETKVMRVVPNWAAVSAVLSILMIGASAIWQAASAVTALESSTKTQALLVSEVKQVREEVSKALLKMAVQESELTHLAERTTDLEYRVTALERKR